MLSLRIMMKKTSIPKIDEITMVMPTKITDTGVYVKLLEYGDLEGLIILSDLSKSRFKSVSQVVKIGKKFPAQVQTVDNVTKHITLTKKYVTTTDVQVCEKNFKNLKYLSDLVNFYIKKLQKDHQITISRETVYQTFIWSLSSDPAGIIYAIRKAAKNFDQIYRETDNLNPKWIECFKEVLALRFKDKEVLLEAIMEITCLREEGIETIKNALTEGAKMVTTECPFKIKVVKSPHYAITLRTTNPETAIEQISLAIETVKIYITEHGGNFKIIKIPEIVLDGEYQPVESDSESDCETESGTE